MPSHKPQPYVGSPFNTGMTFITLLWCINVDMASPQYLCDTLNTNHDFHNLKTSNVSLTVTKHAIARTA